MSDALRQKYDAIVVGSGPNGLAAAITLVQAGVSTLLVEGSDTLGGGIRSSELTIPGVVHDACAAVHPLGVSSPFFRTLNLGRYGLVWLESPLALAHVLGDGRATTLERSVEATAAQFGEDGASYLRLFAPMRERADALFRMALGPLRLPSKPLLFARFGVRAIRSIRGLTRSRFTEPGAPALLAGIAAHSMLRVDAPVSASFALLMALAGHKRGWPIAEGGSRSIATALARHYAALGGELLLGHSVRHLSQLPLARAYLLDVSPSSLIRIAGDRLSSFYRGRVARFRYGPGVFKVDWVLREAIPWKAPECRRATTVHLAGDIDDIAVAMRAPHEGRVAERPFVLLAQPTVVDPSRAPPGLHVVWAYCHVPHGQPVDALAAIEAQIERHAPGFRDLVVARATRNAMDTERYDPNYVGGDINCGASDLMQLFFRPILKLDPYATSAPEVFLCSSATPPGGGVHGMCGYWAARSALRRRFGREAMPLAVDDEGD